MYHTLFISYDGLTDPLGQSQILPYLKGLTAYGYRFTIISCEKRDRYKKLESKIRSLLQGYPIQWEPLMYHKQPPILSAIYDLQMMKRRARSIHLRDKIDMVHTRSGTPALAGLWLKKKYGIRFLNDIRDFYSQSRVDSGQWPQNKWLYRKVFQYFDKKEKQELENSDGIVCLTKKAEKIIRNSPKYIPDTPIQVIPCSVDLELFNHENISPEKKGKLRRQLGLVDSDEVISYLGSIGTWYLVEEMFLLFNKLLISNSDAKLLIISTNDKEAILRIANRMGTPLNRISITPAARKEVPALLSLSRYSIFFIKPCDSKLFSSPTKLGEIMAMGIPVITNEGIGDVSEIIRSSDAGIVLKNLDDAGLDEAVLETSAREFDRLSIISGARNYFDLRKAINSYYQIYEKINSDVHIDKDVLKSFPLNTQLNSSFCSN